MPGNVLVVDDDPGVRRLLRLLLSDEGFNVDVASSGSDALKHLKRSDPDVIILDLMMPGMHPSEFMEQVRQADHRSPVLVLSASDASLEIGYLLGADDAMEKPFIPEELVERVRRLQDRAAAAQPS